MSNSLVDVLIVAYAEEVRTELLEREAGDWMVLEGLIETCPWAPGTVRFIADSAATTHEFRQTRPALKVSEADGMQLALRRKLEAAEAATSRHIADNDVPDPLGSLKSMQGLKLALSRHGVTVDSAIFNMVVAHGQRVRSSDLEGLDLAGVSRAYMAMEYHNEALRITAARAFDGDMFCAAELLEKHTYRGLQATMLGAAASRAQQGRQN